MSKKKDFDTAALGAVTGGDKKSKRVGRPKDPTKRQPTKTSQEGTKNTETRATFIVNEDDLEKLKAIARLEGFLIKDVIGEAFSRFITAYEKKKGTVDAEKINNRKSIL